MVEHSYSDGGIFASRENDQMSSVFLDGTFEAAPADGGLVLLSVVDGVLMRTVVRAAGGIAAGERARVCGRLAADGGRLAVDAETVAVYPRPREKRDMGGNDLNTALLDGTAATKPKTKLGRRASPGDKAVVVVRNEHNELVGRAFQSVVHEIPVVCLGALARKVARKVRAGARLRVEGRLAPGADLSAAAVAASKIDIG